MVCEKCWADAHRKAQHLGSVFDAYRELLEERKDNPCTKEQQKGEGS